MKGRAPLLLLLFLKKLIRIFNKHHINVHYKPGNARRSTQSTEPQRESGCAPSLNGEGGICHNRYSTYNAAELSPQTGKQPFNPGWSTSLSPGACDPTTSSFFHSPDDVWLSARPRRSSDLSLFVCCHPGNCLQDLHWHCSICPKTN